MPLFLGCQPRFCTVFATGLRSSPISCNSFPTVSSFSHSRSRTSATFSRLGHFCGQTTAQTSLCFWLSADPRAMGREVCFSAPCVEAPAPLGHGPLAHEAEGRRRLRSNQNVRVNSHVRVWFVVFWSWYWGFWWFSKGLPRGRQCHLGALQKKDSPTLSEVNES